MHGVAISSEDVVLISTICTSLHDSEAEDDNAIDFDLNA